MKRKHKGMLYNNSGNYLPIWAGGCGAGSYILQDIIAKTAFHNRPGNPHKPGEVVFLEYMLNVEEKILNVY